MVDGLHFEVLEHHLEQFEEKGKLFIKETSSSSFPFLLYVQGGYETAFSTRAEIASFFPSDDRRFSLAHFVTALLFAKAAVLFSSVNGLTPLPGAPSWLAHLKSLLIQSWKE
ncbi:hypothetical protein [Pajaroellobacter abortibovis]|uniref:hypothetical protein n=1 Tax=Pajaroellobacter abortibovis TaxID=1882918 RepID=UPI0012EBA846|nr:hypothetical protein [Pajaroellobacter abortibovis]